MKKVLLIFLICLLISSCAKSQNEAGDVAPIKLEDGTYFPVKYWRYGNMNTIASINMNRLEKFSDHFKIDEEMALEIAVTVIKRHNSEFFLKPKQYDIEYDEEKGLYLVYVFPLPVEIDGGVSVLIGTNGEIIALWPDG